MSFKTFILLRNKNLILSHYCPHGEIETHKHYILHKLKNHIRHLIQSTRTHHHGDILSLHSWEKKRCLHWNPRYFSPSTGSPTFKLQNYSDRKRNPYESSRLIQVSWKKKHDRFIWWTDLVEAFTWISSNMGNGYSSVCILCSKKYYFFINIRSKFFKL